MEGRSLSDYLLEESRRAADRPTLAEMPNVFSIVQKRLQSLLPRKPFELSETDSDRARMVRSLFLSVLSAAFEPEHGRNRRVGQGIGYAQIDKVRRRAGATCKCRDMPRDQDNVMTVKQSLGITSFSH